jgi:hypothetical protein
VDAEHRPVVDGSDHLHEATFPDDVGLADRAQIELLDHHLVAGLARLPLR